MAQKSAVLIYLAAEAWKQAYKINALRVVISDMVLRYSLSADFRSLRSWFFGSGR